MYQLLLSAYCYEQKLGHLSESLEHATLTSLLEEVTSLRHLSNGIILHICNLDDDDGAGSLRAMTKSMGKMNEYAQSAGECSKILARYRAQIQEFKRKHRNQYIAHRNVEDYPNPLDLPDYRAAFRDIIQTALSALQRIWGSTMEFGFRHGAKGPAIEPPRF